MPSFTASPNVLFDTRVCAVRRLSPGFVRLTLTGPRLGLFGPYGLDQRIKILVPEGPVPDVLDATADGDGLLTEAEWRSRWRSLPVGERPLLRSYTVAGVRPDDREVDIDFYLHSAPGPASALAASALGGERVLLSGPDVRRGRPDHGIQWRPGPAKRVLIAGDEAAFPAIRAVLASLGPSVRADVVVEAADPADVSVAGVDAVAGVAGERHGATVVLRTPDSGHGGPLADAVAAWAREHAPGTAALGSGFYAWTAAESTRVARIRDLLRGAGIAPDRIHAQGYWNARGRTGERRAPAAAAGPGAVDSGAPRPVGSGSGA
ncbi:siderophore-interacting protein [Nocardiopsis sp. RSe5-2]|uniref:Siderophore-interacting protein n=1 Tax=Nocardiopsis endophytica TaxID=3018445 RepID=A0ABT4U6S2_9ACTN|nr:siderophore-interacting protein [Nocardiopsis endophytica]MDA2812658.1 siderophore-interacting protein [Nocardiopsis endophytica]